MDYCDPKLGIDGLENIKVHLNDGSTSIPECAVMLPANEANELDTVLLLGQVGGCPPLHSAPAVN